MAGNPAAHPAGTVSDPALRMTMTAGMVGPGVAVVALHALSIEIVIGSVMTRVLEGWLAGGKIHVSGWPNAVSVASIVNMVAMTSARHKQQPGAPKRQGCLGYRAARQPW